jgi:hypothetical protein
LVEEEDSGEHSGRGGGAPGGVLWWVGG